MATNKGFGLLYEMGCGKTLTSIAVMGAGYQMGKIKRVLIVAPTSVVAVWPKELQEYGDIHFLICGKGEESYTAELLNTFKFVQIVWGSS